MFANIEAVMLDLDGTLVNTLGDFDVALNAMLRELRRPPIGREQIEKLVGRGGEHLVRSALALQDGGLLPDEALFEQAWQSYTRAYARINGQNSQAYPGVAEGLADLQALGLPLVCLTNKPQQPARALLELLGLAGRFALVHGGDTFARKKPDPLPLLETCRLLGTRPAATLMVGDSRNDALAARAAGCPVLLLPYGYNHGLPVQHEDSDGVVADVPAVALLLAQARQAGRGALQ